MSLHSSLFVSLPSCLMDAKGSRCQVLHIHTGIQIKQPGFEEVEIADVFFAV